MRPNAFCAAMHARVGRVFHMFIYTLPTILERDTGIEPVTKPWQGFEIPLHQSRILIGAPGVNRTPDLGLQNRCFTTRTNGANCGGRLGSRTL